MHVKVRGLYSAELEAKSVADEGCRSKHSQAAELTKIKKFNEDRKGGKQELLNSHKAMTAYTIRGKQRLMVM